MKKLMCKILLIVDVLAVVFFYVMSQFLIKYDVNTGVTTDGFGRKLVKAPALFSSSFLGIEEWAGFKWYLIDNIILISLFIMGYCLFKGSTEKNKY